VVGNEIYSVGNMLYCLWVSKFILIPKYVWPSPLNINLANCQNYAQFVSVVVVDSIGLDINLTHCQNYVRLLGPMMMMMISREREKESSTTIIY
jgi:hypothetical protein